MTSSLLLADHLIDEHKQIIRKRSINFAEIRFSLDPPTEGAPSEEDGDHGNDGEIVQETFLISESALTFVGKCVECLEDPNMHPHIHTTALQILLVVCDNQRGLSVLKSTDIIYLLIKLIKTMTKSKSLISYNFSFLDEILILVLLMKLMTKEKALLVEAIDQGLEQLVLLASSDKVHLFPYLKDVFAVMIQDIEFGRKTYDKINEKIHFITTEEVEQTNPHLILNTLWKPRMNPGLKQNFISKKRVNDDGPLEFPIISEIACEPLPYADKNNLSHEKEILSFVNSKLKRK